MFWMLFFTVSCLVFNTLEIIWYLGPRVCNDCCKAKNCVFISKALCSHSEGSFRTISDDRYSTTLRYFFILLLEVFIPYLLEVLSPSSSMSKTSKVERMLPIPFQRTSGGDQRTGRFLILSGKKFSTCLVLFERKEF